jgi:hypothetical protein
MTLQTLQFFEKAGQNALKNSDSVSVSVSVGVTTAAAGKADMVQSLSNAKMRHLQVFTLKLHTKAGRSASKPR